MEFLGVGPGELIFVVIIALVVVGPERLPVLARQAGRFLVTVRNWVQRSPDAAMVLRARQEIEAELANLRESLAEVQSARDEVVKAAREVNTLVKDDVIAPTRATLDEVAQPSPVARTTKPNGLPAVAQPPLDVAAPEPQLVAADGSELIAAPDVAAPEPQLVATDGSELIAAPDVAALQADVAALAEELRRLQATLQSRGLIDPAPLVRGAVPLADAGPVEQIGAAPGAPQEEGTHVEQPVYSRD
ncbi:twin-arginine translocase TatA/TatE family subunit [Chloroflexia bacterium SDU3-3]|nr:twin-arginine translocase TatA/TatE family subunit [Chloroflexia bacterium SDU3-3]